MFKFAICTILLLVTACSEQSTFGITSQKAATLEARISELEKKLSTIESKLPYMAENDFLLTYDTFGSAVDGLVLPKSASFGPESFGGGYVPIFVQGTGFMTIAVKDVLPFASGTKLRVEFGNLNNVDLTNVSMSISYRKLSPACTDCEERMSFDAFGTKTRSISLSETIRGGAWNYVEVNIPDIKPDDLGFLTFSNILNSEILLAKPRP
ncbi:MAG: DUF3251 domain-containing protein [Parvularculaceae bacterium]|nr:DUF3251 domain-containing protein [Parvularculaceae bacterium]